MSLQSIIELYRLSGSPNIQDGIFSATIDFISAAEIIKKIREQEFDNFDEILIDGEELYDNNSDFPQTGREICFTLRLPTSSSNRFYNSISDLLEKNHEISRGKIPNEFYLINRDYFGKIDHLKLPELKRLKIICGLITALSKLAHYHDEKINGGPYKLVFLQPSDSSYSSAIVLETKIERDMLDWPDLNISLVQSLSSKTAKADPHYNAQIGVFSVSLAEFIGKLSLKDSSFTYLVQNWEDFLRIYQQNLSTYLSGFAFHKAKKEVIDTELNMAEKFSKVISDITGKLLGIPISLAGVALIAKSDSVMESLILEASFLLAAMLLAGIIINQQDQLTSISGAKELIFNSFEGKRESFPKELKAALQKMIERLNIGEKNLRNWLIGFRVFSWVPPIIGIVIIIYQYTNWFQTMRHFYQI